MNPIIYLNYDFSIGFLSLKNYSLHDMCVFPILVSFPRHNDILTIFSTHIDLNSPEEVVDGM